MEKTELTYLLTKYHDSIPFKIPPVYNNMNYIEPELLRYLLQLKRHDILINSRNINSYTNSNSYTKQYRLNYITYYDGSRQYDE